MPGIHDVLHWANRTLIAEEVSRRGYRVSPETMNRWHRERAEVPAIVERIVFELFGIGGHNETAPPEWAERLEQKIDLIYESQAIVADQAVARLTRALSSGEAGKVEVMREALADALERTALNGQQGRGPRVVRDEDGEQEASPPPPSSSSAAPET